MQFSGLPGQPFCEEPWQSAMRPKRFVGTVAPNDRKQNVSCHSIDTGGRNWPIALARRGTCAGRSRPKPVARAGDLISAHHDNVVEPTGVSSFSWFFPAPFAA